MRTTDNYLYNYKYDVNQIKVGLTVTGQVQFEIRQAYIIGIYEVWAIENSFVFFIGLHLKFIGKQANAWSINLN